MTFFLAFLAVALLGLTAVLASGVQPFSRRAGTNQSRGGDSRLYLPATGLVEPVASLPPVLLPDRPTASDVDRVVFSLGLRGYRMDQVDQVLDRLAAALGERDAVIEHLTSGLGEPENSRP
ncbi:DivIVA domain-containing protein [Arthrobacter sp. Br18]|uniref:DivIVA domain-containing protein n=1 Tax=Arthrobacter sp. Br18 TaxID=1312954 RepID=UPI00047BF34D|nr:DivIVA domain-containing protein [Arthrobacter sp. Br18]